MATGTGVSPHCAATENGCSKDSMPDMEDDDQGELDSMSQAKAGKPPRNLPIMRHSISQAVFFAGCSDLVSPTGLALKSRTNENSTFLPVFRSAGSCSEIGPKTYMEDEFICVDNLREYLDADSNFPCPGAFYGVFDGHGGIDAASFTKRNILDFIMEDPHFPVRVKKAVRNAFVKAVHALADTRSLDNSSGTTALTALILGRSRVAI